MDDEDEGALGQYRRISAQQGQMRVQETQHHDAALWLEPLASILWLPAIANARSQDQLLIDLTWLGVDRLAARPLQPFTPFLLVGLDELGPVICRN